MPSIGHFVLHSSVMPAITAGPYQLRTEHQGLPFPAATQTTHLQVAAPRFTLPVDQILSSFPPANAEGAFGDRLPQIVLKRRTLPWERNPAGSAAVSETPWLALVVVAEGEAELSTATPVAQCVTQGTALLNPADQDVQQGLYLAVTETVVKKIFPTVEDLPLLAHVREVDINDTELANGDDDGWLAVVLANRLPVFDKAHNKPVRYMACLVNVEGQLAALPAPTPDVLHFNFELAQDWSVLANVNLQGGADPRVMGHGGAAAGLFAGAGLPGAPSLRANANAALALATPTGPALGGALDGGMQMQQVAASASWKQATQKVTAAAADPDARRAVRDTMGMGFRYPIGLFAQEKVLRFPVLAHWSFTTSEGATFETLMQGLDVGLLGSLPPEPAAKPGQAQPAPVAKMVPEVLQTGHLGLDHRARRGDALRAWYRGPCVPLPTARDSVKTGQALPLAHAADQLKRSIPDGREDLSLAAAFEIGRLLALSQLSVVSALLRFRAEQFGAGRVRELLQHALPFALPNLTHNAGDKAVNLGRFVAVQMLDAIANNPDRMLGPQRPLADPGRPLRVHAGELDRLVATGLGLNLDAVLQRGAKVGLLSALGATATPVANKSSQATGGTLAVAHLRAALDQELGRKLSMAAPPVAVVPPPKAARSGARAGQPKSQQAHAPSGAPSGLEGQGEQGERAEHDALDALIADAERFAAQVENAGVEAGRPDDEPTVGGVGGPHSMEEGV